MKIGRDILASNGKDERLSFTRSLPRLPVRASPDESNQQEPSSRGYWYVTKLKKWAWVS